MQGPHVWGNWWVTGPNWNAGDFISRAALFREAGDRGWITGANAFATANAFTGSFHTGYLATLYTVLFTFTDQTVNKKHIFYLKKLLAVESPNKNTVEMRMRENYTTMKHSNQDWFGRRCAHNLITHLNWKCNNYYWHTSESDSS